jgi:hypothetical protein
MHDSFLPGSVATIHCECSLRLR